MRRISIKFYLSLLIIFSLSLLSTLSAQTTQEILAKNIEARGGIKQLSKIKTLKYSGTFKETGLNADLTLFFKNPNKLLFDLKMGDVKAKIGYDGRTLWKQFPGRAPRPMPKNSDKLIIAYAEHHEFLFTHRKKGYELELAGEENFEGTDVFKIKVIPEDNDQIYLLIDREKYIVVSCFLESPQGDKDVFFLRDFKDTDGILLPHTIKARKTNGEITNLTFDRIEANVEIDDSLFRLPKSSSDKKAQEEGIERPPLEYSYRIPEQVDDGWKTASLTDVGMNTEPMIELMNNLLNRNDHFTHSILIIKNGKLVFEEYFKGKNLVVNKDTMQNIVSPEGDLLTKEMNFDRDTLHFQASVTKSFTSLLFGIALDKKMIRSVDEKMFSFFPEYSDLGAGKKADITIKHMLTMSSGIPWSESAPYSDKRNYINQLLAADDPLKYVLELDLFASPGRRFNYNSGTTVLLGEVIRRASKTNLTDFAKTWLFKPLGITKFQMINLPKSDDTFFASSALYLRPRDMAKLGQMFLQEGLWNDQRIVSADWIRESVKKSIRLPSNHSLPYFAESYGYQWWLGTFYTKKIKAYAAAGFGGQFIIVMPEINMVVVITAGNWDKSSPFLMYDYVINNYVLSAIK